jgi:hypothetical protein
MTDELFARIGALAEECAVAGDPALGAAMAHLGAIAAMNRAREAYELLEPLAREVDIQALRMIAAGPGSSRRLQQ